MEKILSEKFVAVYNRKDGDLGFVGSDSHSGGYPHFDDTPDPKYLRDEPMEAVEDADMIRSTMRTFYGNDEVDFGTVRVVRYSVVIEDISDLEEIVQETLLNNARGKLDEDELKAMIDWVRKHD